MADHDLEAELLGYRNELARYERHGEDDRAASVREQIERVESDVRKEAERLEADAGRYDEAGQGVPAAMARNEARRYRALLGDDDQPAKAARGRGRPRKETAEDKTPTEKA